MNAKLCTCAPIDPNHSIPQHPPKKQRFVTALVSETLRHKDALDQVLDRSHLRATLRKDVRDANLLLLLLYDLLYGKGIQGGGQVKRLLLVHEPALRAAAAGVEAPPPQTPRTPGVDGDGDGDGGKWRFPRYARVNPLKLSVAGAIVALAGEKKKGGEEEEKRAVTVVVAREDIQVCPVQRYVSFFVVLACRHQNHPRPTQHFTSLQLIAHNTPTPTPKRKQEDPHIPGLLALPPGTDLHAHPLVQSGALVLQDKASCFSAQALLGDVLLAASAAAAAGKGEKSGKKPMSVCGDVIDACAAPGMCRGCGAVLQCQRAKGRSTYHQLISTPSTRQHTQGTRPHMWPRSSTASPTPAPPSNRERARPRSSPWIATRNASPCSGAGWGTGRRAAWGMAPRWWCP